MTNSLNRNSRIVEPYPGLKTKYVEPALFQILDLFKIYENILLSMYPQEREKYEQITDVEKINYLGHIANKIDNMYRENPEEGGKKLEGTLIACFGQESTNKYLSRLCKECFPDINIRQLQSEPAVALVNYIMLRVNEEYSK